VAYYFVIIEVYVFNGNYLGRFKMPEAAEVCKLIFPFLPASLRVA
jgi:hypothetical protein